uniref:Variant surface glycoprotein 1125.1650 n=1 Tax=Trypanosoma brucei TaxID=5691 RepID=M4SX27_9TRYP|nr:variant surface glycoprotein 445 [Trypanosoma brucei]APD73812.1 variant surface glycoprotein 1125.1650 [Trypanosoma brucei]
MTKPIPHLFLMLPLTLIGTRYSESGAGHALDKAVWDKFCDLSEDLGKAAAGAATKLSSINALRQRLAQTALRFQIYAQQTANFQDSEKAATLATYFAALADRAANQVTTNIGPNLITASADAAYAKGRLDELLSLMAQTKGSSHGCLVDSSGNTQSPPSGTTINGRQCSLNLKHNAAPYTKPDTLGADGFTADPLPTTEGNNAQTSSKNCALLKISAAGLGATEAVAAATISYGGGIFTGTQSNDQLTGAKLTQIKATHANNPTIWSAAHAALQTIDALNVESYSNDSKDDDPNSGVIRATTLVMINKESTEGEEGTIKAKSMFPKPAREDIKKFIIKMEAHKVAKGELGLQDATPLGQIGGVQKLTVLLVRSSLALSKKKKDLIAEMKKKDAEENAKTAEEKEKECNTKGKDKQEECEKLESQGCVFNKDRKDGEKCTLKKDVKAELEKATENQEGVKVDEKKKECKGKQQKDCTGNCKWENNACKDSVFLVNKKIAPIVSAFVALLF